MSDEIIFYYNPRSRAQMAHWMLEEVGAPYKTVLMNFETGDTRKPEDSWLAGFIAPGHTGHSSKLLHIAGNDGFVPPTLWPWR